MRYRAQDSSGDYRFGPGPFLTDSPEAVAQAVRTRLELWEGEWFLDTSAGTPYATRILGHDAQATADWAIRQRILGTEGVTEITEYTSQVDPGTRRLSVQATVATRYGTATLEATL